MNQIVKTITLSLTIGSISAQAAVLEFETVNGIVPIEGMSISNQFQAHFGVSFQLGNGAYPVIGKKGVPRACWQIGSLNPTVYDTMHPNDPRANAFGEFFLTDDGITGTQRTVILDFVSPTSSASGYMIDIDGQEQMTVTAYSDDGTNVLAELIFNPGDPDTGEGRSTPWSFDRPSADIAQIRFRHTGATSSPNIAFDSFASSYTPSPQQTASLSIFTFAGLLVQGDAGRPYLIEYSDNIGSTGWLTLTNTFLPDSRSLFVDFTSTNSPHRFYRVISLP